MISLSTIATILIDLQEEYGTVTPGESDWNNSITNKGGTILVSFKDSVGKHRVESIEG